MEHVKVGELTFGGSCVAKVKGKTVFIPYAIPNEECTIEIIQEKKSYDIAKIIDITKASPFRVKPICPLYEKCGGCNLMHIEENAQRNFRKHILESNLQKHKINFPEIKIIYGSPLNYRARVQLCDGGFAEKNSNKNVQITNCPIATPEVNDFLKSLHQENNFSKTKNSEKLYVFGDKRIAGEKKVFSSFSKNDLSTYLEQNIVTISLLGKQLSFDVTNFFQSNMEVLERSIPIIMKDLNGKHALDMYAGCGTFSAFLLDHFEKCTLVEQNKTSLTFAEKNLHGQNHKSFCMSGKNWVKNCAPFFTSSNEKFDAAIIDPPRSGMESEVLSYFCKNHVKHIRSISCDPVTHARDLKKLLESDYTLDELYLLDFYPNTSHIESVAFLHSNKVK